MRTKPMTFEDHKELGKKVKHIRGLLFEVFDAVSEHYGKTHIMMRSLKHAMKYFDRMQCHYDDVAAEEHYRQHGDAVNNLYYGGTKEEENNV